MGIPTAFQGFPPPGLSPGGRGEPQIVAAYVEPTVPDLQPALEQDQREGDDPDRAGELVVVELDPAGAFRADQQLLQAVDEDPDLLHVPVCREEEGIGICAGAYLVGKKCAAIMQNGGFFNSNNAIVTTLLQYHIPLLLMIYFSARGLPRLDVDLDPVTFQLADAGFQKPEDTPVLRTEDTRMSYGG